MDRESRQKIKIFLERIGLLGPATFFRGFWWFLSVERKRWFACILLHLTDFLPDLFIVARLRCYVLRLAGCKIKSPGTSLIRKGFFTEYVHNIEIGAACNINKDVYFCANGPITIGEYVRIGNGVRIINISHSGVEKIEHIIKPVIIKDYCGIHASSIILPGSTLEKGVFVSAGAVLGGSTVEGGIYMGNPARLIKIRNEFKKPASLDKTNGNNSRGT